MDVSYVIKLLVACGVYTFSIFAENLDRARLARERREAEQRKRLDELRAHAAAAQAQREKRDEERRRRQAEQRARDDDRRQQVSMILLLQLILVVQNIYPENLYCKSRHRSNV